MSNKPKTIRKPSNPMSEAIVTLTAQCAKYFTKHPQIQDMYAPIMAFVTLNLFGDPRTAKKGEFEQRYKVFMQTIMPSAFEQCMASWKKYEELTKKKAN